MNWKNLFVKATIHITIVKKTENGLIFHVKNGKGLLCGKYGAIANRGLYALTFDGIPLIKFHGDEYLCPTCEKLVSAGYGLDAAKNQSVYELSEALNEPFVSLEKSLRDMEPLLGLLSPGYYMLSEKNLFPTNGDGKFFWCLGSTPEPNRAAAPVYDNGRYFGDNMTAKYILPTQSPRLFNPARVNHYLTRDNTRAIAYALPFGYLCALLDGHHKACAAALRGKPVQTLVIEPPSGLAIPQESNGMKGCIFFSDCKLYGDEIQESFEAVKRTFAADVRMTPEEAQRYVAIVNREFDTFSRPAEWLKTAEAYYDVFTYACVEWAGDLSAERLSRILDGTEAPDDADVLYIVHALYGTDEPRFAEFAARIGKREQYRGIWFDVFSLLATIKTDAVENFFIDFLVHDDRLRPYLTRIADDYLAVGNA